MRSEHSFASTLRFESWGHRVRTLDLPYRAPAPHRLRDEIAVVRRILEAARSERGLLLNSSSGWIYPDVVACVILGLLAPRRRPAVALMGDMWEPNRGLRGLMERLVVRLADRAVDRYIVYSTGELASFPAIWGVDPAKMRTALCYCHTAETDPAGEDPPREDYVFAGGDSARDYEPLVEAAGHFPGTRFVLATSWTSRTPLPPNVELVLARRTPTSHAEFIRLMRGARAVVVPIRRDIPRSIGLQTLLNGLLFGKPTVIVDSHGVRDHAQDGVDALVVDGSVADYRRALEHVLDPAHGPELEAMGRRAREKARSFSKERFAEALHDEMTALLASRGVPAANAHPGSHAMAARP
jgi:glycosyltransferase involved in cell wall biosynthesis